MKKIVMTTLLVTILGTIIATLVLYYVFGIGKGSANEIYNVSSEGQAGGITAGKVEITKEPFSQTQSIKVLPPSLGGNDSLNLANLATLKLYVPYSLTSVTLLLGVIPTTLPDEHNSLFTTENFQYFNQSTGTSYVFDTTNNQRHDIAVAGRVFTVTLLKISKLDVANVPGALEYQFGIVEK